MARSRRSPAEDENPLFSGADSQPLAARMRPRKLDDFIGQEHIVGPGRLLRRAIQADMLSSVIFSGPPGTGKTTLAMVIANTTKSRFVSLNAVLSGVKDVREAIENARRERELYDRRTILFVDEVHRWNKAQQDALLPWVENGTVILIGATTENPFFEVNSALVSRSRIFQLKALSADDLRRVARAALEDPARGYGNIDIDLDEEALDHLVSVAEGDARSLLNALQLAVETTPEAFPPPEGQRVHVTREIAEESIQRRAVLYDKEGDYHFDIISAFIKSLRGSDPDAALYWMARMIEGGEDPHYLFRRMLILASEDVGLADPQALGVVESAAAAFDRVGMPEGQFHLTQALLYLATTEKSNSTLGYYDALRAVREEQQGQVPRHLQDPNRDAKGFGHGEGYLYPHAYRDHWVAQQYLPGALQGRLFYQPSDRGYEARVREAVERRRELQLAAMSEEPEAPEILSFGPQNRRLEAWLRRSSEGVLGEIRDAAFAALRLPRHATVLLCGTGIGFLLWEARRRSPEGQVYAIFRRSEEQESAEHHAGKLELLERPWMTVSGDALRPGDLSSPGAAVAGGKAAAPQATLPERFDGYLGRGLLYHLEEPARALSRIAGALAPQGRMVLIDPIPRESTRLSALMARRPGDGGGAAAGAAAGDGPDDCAELLREAEARLHAGGDPRLAFDRASALRAAEKAGLEAVTADVHRHSRELLLRRDLLRSWLDGLRESYRDAAGDTGFDGAAWERCSDAVLAALAERRVDWERSYLLLQARRPAVMTLSDRPERLQ